jgi:hypothetical protein
VDYIVSHNGIIHPKRQRRSATRTAPVY